MRQRKQIFLTFTLSLLSTYCFAQDDGTYFDKISLYMNAIGISTAIVIGFSALITAAAVYLVMRENKSLREEEQTKLKRLDEVIQKAKNDAVLQLERIEREAETSIGLRIKVLHLRHLIKTGSDLNSDDIYNLLTEMLRNNDPHFLPVYKQIKKLNIDPEVTELANKGLDKIGNS